MCWIEHTIILCQRKTYPILKLNQNMIITTMNQIRCLVYSHRNSLIRNSSLIWITDRKNQCYSMTNKTLINRRVLIANKCNNLDGNQADNLIVSYLKIQMGYSERNQLQEIGHIE